MDDIGRRIRDTRKSAGLSQVDFAASLAITQGFLSAVETGKNQPTAEFLTRLANIYNTDINWLLTGKGKGLAQRAAEGMREDEGPQKGLAQRIHEESVGATPEKPHRGLAQRISEEGPGVVAETPMQVAAHAHFDALNAVEGMGLLTKIYTSGDAVFIRAINANLLAFSDAIENRARAETTINAIAEMREQMRVMNGEIADLRRENQNLRQKILSRDDRDEGEAVG